MASYRQQVMGVVLVLMVMVLGGARAQSSGCTNTLMGLAPCLNYVTGNTSTPSPSCCSQLSTVVQSQPRCLCSLLNGNAPNIGVTINQTLAIALPGACQVQTPSISQCNAVANGPASGPTSSTISPTASQEMPSQDTPETEAPATSSTPTITPGLGSGSGSKTTPSTNNNASDGIKFGASSYLMFIVVFFGMMF